jgi:hypothetical protein
LVVDGMLEVGKLERIWFGNRGKGRGLVDEEGSGLGFMDGGGAGGCGRKWSGERRWKGWWMWKEVVSCLMDAEQMVDVEGSGLVVDRRRRG